VSDTACGCEVKGEESVEPAETDEPPLLEVPKPVASDDEPLPLTDEKSAGWFGPIRMLRW
jgi:hypothetical protein